LRTSHQPTDVRRLSVLQAEAKIGPWNHSNGCPRPCGRSTTRSAASRAADLDRSLHLCHTRSRVQRQRQDQGEQDVQGRLYFR
jgi:hypothetical protein